MTAAKPNSSGRLPKMAVLCSGGVESCCLLSLYNADYSVHPLYIKSGFPWETQEIKNLETLLNHMRLSNIAPLTVIDTNIAAFMQTEWMANQEKVPRWDAPDKDIIIPGRNMFFFTMGALWCATHDCQNIALGILGHPDFYDHTDTFIQATEKYISLGTNKPIKVHTPFRSWEKEKILAQYQSLPLHLTLTCAKPHAGYHCGACNKCNERRLAFKKAGIEDQTIYQDTHNVV